MNKLENLQTRFQAQVMTGQEEVAGLFVGDETATAEERLGVYYDAYRLRLVEILTGDFPGLCALMSEEEFRQLGMRYIDSYPSQNPSVRWFGQHLAEFLAVDPAFADQPCLAEMARFEWARGLAFDGSTAAVASLEDLGEVPPADWPSVTLELHPTLQRSQSDWNVGPIWRAVCAEESVPVPEKLGEPAQWAVWRRDVKVYWRSLSDPEATALDAFGAGETFAEVCGGLCESIEVDEVPAAIARMLNQWITEGLVTRISVGDS
jgi:hypothetical protein